MKHIVLIGFLLTFTACYTVINHPRVTDPQNPQYSHAVYFTDDCSQCHADTREFNIPATASYRLPRVDYISQNERWNYFYEFPWWYRPIFTGGGGTVAGSGNQPLPTISARRRFPGAGGSTATPPSGTITGGGYSPGGTIVGDTHKSSASTSPSSGNNVQRQKAPQPGRSAIRGSGNKKSSSHSSGKVQRRKKK